MRKINQEKRLLEIIKKNISESYLDKTILGIGDDAAIVRGSDYMVISSDAIVENTHFQLDYYSFQEIGWKSIAVNQSDLAAMGASPDFFSVTIGVPSYVNENDFGLIFSGMKAACEKFGGEINGGDIVKSPNLFISVTAIGNLKKTNSHFMSRNDAKVGQRIAVTGELGNSSVGLMQLKNNKCEKSIFTRSHKKVFPRIQQGIRLVNYGVRTCIDISDGLHSDLQKLCELNDIEAKIFVDKIPFNKKIKELFPEEFMDIVIAGGEDFELLFTFDSLDKKLLDEVHVIGEVSAKTKAGTIQYISSKNEPYTPKISPWEHFNE